MTAIPV